jgi:hypothetical protein
MQTLNSHVAIKLPTKLEAGTFWQRITPARDDQLGLAMSWVYFIIKCTISLATLVGVCIAFVILGVVIGSDTTDSISYSVNTFLPSADVDSNVSWAVLFSPASTPAATTALSYSNVQFEHFYECMYVARMGQDRCQLIPNVNDTYLQFKPCIIARYAAELSPCTSDPNLPAGWPNAKSYSACVNKALNGNRGTLGALKSCVRTDSWPIYEQPQDVDTEYFLGAFSWPFLMLTGYFLFATFALYTIYPIDYEETTIIEYGKVSLKSSFSRLGMVWIALPIVASIAWAAISLTVSFRAGSVWINTMNNPYPTTQQTNVVTASMALVFYFLLELTEYYDQKNHKDGHEYDEKKVDSKLMRSLPGTLNMAGYTPVPQVGYYFPDPAAGPHEVSSIRDAGMTYTPVLLNLWSDAYLFDVLFFVGAIGVTLHLRTDDVYHFFFLLSFYRIAQMGFVRMIYKSYVYSDADDSETNSMKDSGLPSRHESGKSELEDKKNAMLCLKINAIALHFASLCALIAVFYLMWNNQRIWVEILSIQNLFMLGLLFPEVVRLLGHIWLLLRTSELDKSKGVYILVFAHFLWMYDLIVRAFFLYILWWGDTNFKGTKPFIVDRYNALNSTLYYVNGMSANM